MKAIERYVKTWQERGYEQDIPDDVPTSLMRLGLAPSYKAVALAILQNDLHFVSLGMTAPQSRWYSELKRIEIAARGAGEPTQHRLIP